MKKCAGEWTELQQTRRVISHLCYLNAGQFAHLAIGSSESIHRVSTQLEGQLTTIQHLTTERVSFLFQLCLSSGGICTVIMLNDHSNPIPSDTVTCTLTFSWHSAGSPKFLAVTLSSLSSSQSSFPMVCGCTGLERACIGIKSRFIVHILCEWEQ